MILFRPALAPVLAVATLMLAALAAQAQTAASSPSKKKAPAKAAAAKPHKKAVAKPAPAPAPVEVAVPDATPEQISAAEKVFYGHYACEFDQAIDITASPKHFGYVELKLVKSTWLMKPVLSSTGAIRLEDVTGETLMVQILSKSMLLNVRTGHRLVDDCISPKQREFIEAQRAAKAAEAASAAAAGTPASASSTALIK